jgi:HAD superfamily hydrolase (TIGR01549 family)
MTETCCTWNAQWSSAWPVFANDEDVVFDNVEWLFFDLGSVLANAQNAYAHDAYEHDELLYKNTRMCFKKLSRRFKIGIIANQCLATKKWLEQHGILQYIDLVIISKEEDMTAKTNQEIFELALNKSDCRPNNAVMIGDRIENDIIPAKSLGFHTIWLKHGLGQHFENSEDICKADFIVYSLYELCNLLV